MRCPRCRRNVRTSRCSSRASIFRQRLSTRVTKRRSAASKMAGVDTVDVAAAAAALMETAVATTIGGVSVITAEAEVTTVDVADSDGVVTTTVGGTTTAAAEAATTTTPRRCP